MKKFEIVNELLNNNETGTRNAFWSNNLLIKLLSNFDNNENFEMRPTKNEFLVNRGDLAELIIKKFLGCGNQVAPKDSIDLELNQSKFNLQVGGYEIKFATNYARASANTPNSNKVILVSDLNGGSIYLVNHTSAIKRYSRTTGEQFGIRLTALEAALGL